MHLRTLLLRNFRLYEEAVFEFSPRVNTIFGENAQGKTTILEAIHFLIAGRSFRTSQLDDLIKEGADYFYVEACFKKHGIDQRLKVFYGQKERKIFYNNTACSSFANLLGVMQGVVMTPDDAALVKGAPVLRRQFLDLQIAQVDPLYIHHLLRYNRAMRQRNCLLRAKNLISIESWEKEMANAAAYIVQQRQKTVEELNEASAHLHTSLTAEKQPLALGYRSTMPVCGRPDVFREAYLEQMHKNRFREMGIGATFSGPHKDDLSIGLGQKEVRFFASEGQQRSCSTALRMAEWQRLKSRAEDLPLMLIDDIGVSLDTTRRTKLFGHLAQLEQVFLTTTQKLDIESHFIEIKK